LDFDEIAHTWWTDESELWFLRDRMNPIRFSYFKNVLLNDLSIDPEGLDLLDIGSGGGYLAEEFARLGCSVTGIDPSEQSLKSAEQHANENNLDIKYLKGVGEDIPFAENSFDIVCCCDVLEHVDDLELVIRETGRVLKNGGLYFYDTVNRTFRSMMVMIWLLQEWGPARLAPKGTHEWRKFVKPKELLHLLKENEIENRGLRGISANTNLFNQAWSLFQFKCLFIDDAEFDARMKFGLSGDPSIGYFGWGVKRVT